jgi:hypothetical protein
MHKNLSLFSSGENRMNRALPIAKFLAIALALVCLIALPSVNLLGQAISGNLVGSVSDSTGAAVANADVEATNVGTNVTSKATTNGSGEYRIDNLIPGSYRVTAKSTGFKTISQTVDVQLNRTGTLNLTLVPGSASETVEVSGAPPLIDTTTAQLGTTYEQVAVQSIPTASIGLGVINLSLLQAGVGSSGGLGAGTGPSIGGMRPRDNNFTIEGVDNNDKGVTGPLVQVPNDAVSNFTILQNQFSPEFGHSNGGQFNTVIQTGTNSFHGTAYEYFQNKNLNAVDNLVALQFVGSDKTAKNPRFDSNRFGGQLGGPIFKDKLFFFGNFEYTPTGQSATPPSPVVPTAAGYNQLLAMNGNVSAANVNAFQTWAVAPSGTPSIAVCNVATAFAACPAANQVLIDGGTLPIIAPNYTNFEILTTGMDYNLSDRDQIRGRYIYNKFSNIDIFATLPAFYEPLNTPYHLVNLAEFHTFTPSISNEFRVGFHRIAQDFPVGKQTFLPTLDAFPNITADDLGINVGPDPNAPQFAIQNLYQAIDNVTWVKGPHTLKFGIEGRKYITPQKFIQRSRGDYEWFNFSDYAYDFIPDFAERSFGNVGYSGDQYGIYGFVNDIWKLSRNFTINLGLRYEYTSTPFGWTQQTLNGISDVPNLIHFGSPQAPKKDFMPRVGFAYSPGTSGNMSIRGGFGLGYDVLYDNIGVLSRPPQIGSTDDCPVNCQTPFLANGGIPPLGLSGITVLDQQTARLTTASFLPNNVKYPYAESWNLGVQRTFGTNYTAEVNYVGSRGVNLNTQNRINIQDIVTPSNFLPTFTTCDTTCQNLAAATTAPGQTTLATLNTQFDNIGYMVPAYLNAGFGTTNTTAACPGPPCAAQIVGFVPLGASTYHGLQSQLSRRFANGLYLQGAYTYSHLIDNSTADFFSTIIAPRRPQDFQNLPAERANSVLDHRHRFTMAMVYETQWYNHSSNWFLKNVLGGYQISPEYFYESGQGGTIQSGRDVNMNTDNAGDRVIFNPSGTGNTGSDVTPLSNASGDTVGYVANDPTARYIRGGTGALANTGRNTLPSPPINNWDLAVGKSIKVGERFQFKLSAQFLNVLNHAQYTTGLVNRADSISDTGTNQRNVYIPSGAPGLGGNLDPTATGFSAPRFNNFRSAFSQNPRLVQLGAKIIF